MIKTHELFIINPNYYLGLGTSIWYGWPLIIFLLMSMVSWSTLLISSQSILPTHNFIFSSWRVHTSTCTIISLSLPSILPGTLSLVLPASGLRENLGLPSAGVASCGKDSALWLPLNCEPPCWTLLHLRCCQWWPDEDCEITWTGYGMKGVLIPHSLSIFTKI